MKSNSIPSVVNIDLLRNYRLPVFYCTGEHLGVIYSINHGKKQAGLAIKLYSNPEDQNCWEDPVLNANLVALTWIPPSLLFEFSNTAFTVSIFATTVKAIAN